jgi:ABC-type multidrug transport system ATPase subunit
VKTQAAVEISHLSKAYGNVVAVDDVSLSVAEGEIFGILGPNGAGKTTTAECAIGLRSPDSGTIRLLGLDPLGAAVEAMQDSMLGGTLPVAPLLVLAAYAVVFGLLARRFFRWE